MLTERHSRWSTRWGAISLALTGIAASCWATTGTLRVPAHRLVPVAARAYGFSGDKWGDPTTDSAAKDTYGRNSAEKDPGSLYTVEQAIGARTVWQHKDASGRQVTGQGVAVAVLDSGIAPVPGLDAAAKIYYGPDLSSEAGTLDSQQDTFGHGTFMAGIIAGRPTTNPSSTLASAPAQVQLGVAPDATLLSMKLAGSDGGTDVSQVIAALDWVAQHPVLPNGTRVRVINLSYGTDSAQGYGVDPLAAAAENAWRHGIVVVVSAGNGGSANRRLTNPAIDPYVLAVAASDSGNRTDGWDGDHAAAASYSSVGNAARRPDLAAPGTSIVSARNPGSWIDSHHPEGRIAGDLPGRLFRGSGTSQAAAVVSGAIADLLQAYPSLTPDQVKFVLAQSAQPMKNADINAVGAGTLDLGAAYDVAARLLGGDRTGVAMRAAAVQGFPASTGLGSIDSARGTSVLIDVFGFPLRGEFDTFGTTWNGATWMRASSSLTAWSGGNFLGLPWTGDGWQTTWFGATTTRWSSARWSSARWSSARWSSNNW